MKILITGAGGYLGNKLKSYLGKRHEVDAWSRQQVDLTNLEQLSQHLTKKYNAVIHCASQGRNTVLSTEVGIIANNLEAFNNLLTFKNHFGTLINIASGAEFDLTKNIFRLPEAEIWNRFPVHSYGRSKNLISRLVWEQENFFNLRLFGCFDSDEDDRRLLKKANQALSTNQKFNLQNREFDMVSFLDFAKTVEQACLGKLTEVDINVVYNQKYRLSDILKLYCDANGFDYNLVNVTEVSPNNYSGDGTRASKYESMFEGLTAAINRYK